MKKRLQYVGILLCMACIICPSNVLAEKKGISGSDIVTLEKCVDGDTARFQLSDGTVIKTRFLAIDTPESVHPTKEVELYGKDASEYTCNRLTNAKEIKLEYDGSSEKIDKYGRTLAWVFVDGELLQRQLVDIGYAKVAYLYGDYEYTETLQEIEEQAKTSKKGIWSEENVEKVDDKKENEKSKDEKDDSISEEKKSFFKELIDYTLGKIFQYIDKLLEKIVKFVESML